MIVVDASAAVAFIVDNGRVGEFLSATIETHEIAYPSLMPFEVAHVLRRLCLNNVIDQRLAQTALGEAAGFRGQVFEFADLANRIWQLRNNLTAYDAAYVALAELIDVPLLTLDTRLMAAPGVRCRFVEVPGVA
ncbi:MAG: type II toxin-antitoxin system VapC family toxin [Actinomycetia bacterium]|nr:type II toxin-antitoxin system VapC family toxin [Actinomycetes bacterium]